MIRTKYFYLLWYEYGVCANIWDKGSTSKTEIDVLMKIYFALFP